MMDLSDAGLRERADATFRSAQVLYDYLDKITVDYYIALRDAARAEQRERDAKIAETKAVCEIHAIDSGERDPLCAITASTAAVCITHGRDIAAAIRAQDGMVYGPLPRSNTALRAFLITASQEALIAFALRLRDAARAEQRERDAGIADEISKRERDPYYEYVPWQTVAINIAAAIRAQKGKP